MVSAVKHRVIVTWRLSCIDFEKKKREVEQLIHPGRG